jgi:hypothetical protein
VGKSIKKKKWVVGIEPASRIISARARRPIALIEKSSIKRTALLVIETQAGNMSAYIPTNVRKWLMKPMSSN